MLVIIGLLVAGIVLGQAMIHAAGLRAQITQLQQYKTAVNTFLTKYNCLPGDCANATTFFGATDPGGNPINNGNGDGNIDTDTGTSFQLDFGYWRPTAEYYGVFQELSIARMIPYTPKAVLFGPNWQVGYGPAPIAMYPSDALFISASYNFQGQGGGVFASTQPRIDGSQKGSNAIWLVGCNNNAAHSWYVGEWEQYCGVFLAIDLLAIDQKIDDGQPLSGAFIGFGGLDNTSTYNNCLTTSGSTSTYNTTYTTPQCEAAYIIN